MNLVKTDEQFRNVCHKIGDQLQLTQSTLTKCETAICKIYGHTSNDVNLVRYNMLNQGAESQDIPQLKMHYCNILREQTIKH